MSSFENLVFEGGGVKGSAYAGCIQILAEQGLYDQVKRVAGTSAGSITATLLALGAGSDGLTESVLDTDFNQFVYDRGGWIMDIWRVFRHYGIHSGNSFVKILKDYLKKYVNDPNLTFAELEKKRIKEPHIFKHLTVVGSNITTQKSDIFDCVRTPNIPIWEAVRCSMSIPVVFEPYKINNNYYVDGGLGWIYPIDIYDTKKLDGEDIRNPNTLGFYLEPSSQKGLKPPKSDIHSLKTAAEAMIGFLFDNSNSKHLHPGDRQRSVFIDDLGVSSTNFDISKEEIQKLIDSGRKATEAYLKNRIA
ncbi:MAG: patatin-like phospholipase family protein [Chitinophagales bacterium]